MSQLPATVSALLTAFNPNHSQIVQVIKSLGGMPEPFLKVVLAMLDDGAMRRLGEWCQTYAQIVNDVHYKHEDSASMQASNYSGDFFEVMEQTRYVGERLGNKDLEVASNYMTKAIKAQNWREAIMVGIALAKLGV